MDIIYHMEDILWERREWEGGERERTTTTTTTTTTTAAAAATAATTTTLRLYLHSVFDIYAVTESKQCMYIWRWVAKIVFPLLVSIDAAR